MRIALAIALLIASVYGAVAQFNGCAPGLCPGIFSNGGPNNSGSGPVTPDCVTATTGQIDLSVCSNAVYVGLVI